MFPVQMPRCRLHMASKGPLRQCHEDSAVTRAMAYTMSDPSAGCMAGHSPPSTFNSSDKRQVGRGRSLCHVPASRHRTEMYLVVTSASIFHSESCCERERSPASLTGLMLHAGSSAEAHMARRQLGRKQRSALLTPMASAVHGSSESNSCLLFLPSNTLIKPHLAPC